MRTPTLRDGPGAGETDAFAASGFPAATPLRPRRRDLALGHHDRGAARDRRRRRAPVDRDDRGRRTLRIAPRAPTTPSCSTSPTSSRWCRRCSPRPRSCCSVPRWASALDEVIAQARSVLDGDAASDRRRGVPTQFTFLGDGWAYGIALEAALKMREAAQFWTEAYPQLEYRHGPIAIAEPGRAVWVFGTPAPGPCRPTSAPPGRSSSTTARPARRPDPGAPARGTSRRAAGLDPDRPAT